MCAVHLHVFGLPWPNRKPDIDDGTDEYGFKRDTSQVPPWAKGKAPKGTTLKAR